MFAGAGTLRRRQLHALSSRWRDCVTNADTTALDDVVRPHDRVLIVGSGTEGRIEGAMLSGTFDVVVFPGFTYGAIPESARRIAMLARVALHLRPDARVVISYVEPSAPLRTHAVRLAQITARLSGSDWRPEPNDVLRIADGQLRFDHWFTPDEIDREIQQAGYQIAFNRSPADRPTTLVLTRKEPS